MNIAAAGASSVDELGQQVIDSVGIPKDRWEIAAQLEVIGLRDVDARRYGSRDLFDLASQIHDRFLGGAYRFIIEGEDPEPRRLPGSRFVRHYLAGLAFALPMVLQAASMIIWGYGLWGATEISLRIGTGIALGFIASYILSGGFTQAIVRRGLFYMYQREEILARWSVLRGWTLAVQTATALLVPALLLNLVFGILPWRIVLVAICYYAALTLLWLNWSILYVVRKTHVFLGITIIALAAVLVSAKAFGANALVANAIGLIIADAAGFAAGRFYLRRAVQRSEADAPINPPRLAVLIYSTSRFFLYGLLYSTFLFADRIIAWTASLGREDFPPYPFWLSVRYELGMDLALIVVVISSGVIEYSIQRFSEELIPAEKRTMSASSRSFADEEARRFTRRSIAVALTALASIGIAVAVAAALRSLPNDAFQQTLRAATTQRVFWCAAFSYVFFLVALHAILLLLTLSRVELAVRAVAISLAVNATVGFVCSRAFHYAAAVAGLAAGSIVLMLLSLHYARRVLRKLDYYYYAAY